MKRLYRTIVDLQNNEQTRVLNFEDEALACRLTAMGILPASLIELVRRAPLGDAYYIKADGVRFALRYSEAKSVLVEL